MGFGSFLERTARAVGGVVGSAKEIAEIGVDIVNPWGGSQPEAPDQWWDPRDVAGSALGMVFEDIERGVDEAAQQAFGPEGAIGSVVGGMGEGLRADIGRNVVEPLGRMDEMLQHQVNAGAMAGAPTAIGPGGLPMSGVATAGHTERVQQSIGRSDEQSFGRSAIIALHSRDPLDPASAGDLFDDPMWRVTSGTLDLLSAWYVPDLLEGAALGARTARRASRANRTPGARRTPREVVDEFIDGSTSRWVPGKSGDFTARTTGSGSGVGNLIRDKFMESGFDRWEALIDDHWRDIRASIDDTPLRENTLRRTEIAKAHQEAKAKVDDLTARIGDADIDPFTQGALDVREGSVLTAADEMERLDLQAAHLKETFDRDVNQRLATRIYDQMGGQQVVHQPLANALAHAGSRAERELVWRTFAGDPDAVARLRQMNDELATSVDTTKWSEQFAGDDTLIGEQATSAFLNQPAHLQSLQKTAVNLRARRRRIERIEELQGWGTQGPLPKAPGPVGRAFREGKEHVWSRIDGIDPITGRARYLWDKVPGNVWDMNNNLFMDRINGWMGDVGMDAAERELYRGKLMEQSNAAGRFRVLSELEDEIVRRQADKIGVDRSVVNHVLKVAQEARGNNRKIMSSGAKYGAIRLKNGDISLPDDPVVRGQFADTFTPVDTSASKSALRRFKAWQDKNPDAAENLSQALSKEDLKPGSLGTLGNVAQEAVETLHSLWKLEKVARPAFTGRAFGLDEVPRMMSSMGSMAAILGGGQGAIRAAGQFFQTHGMGGAAAVGGFAGLTLGGGLFGVGAGVALGAALGAPGGLAARRASRVGLLDEAMGDTVDAAAANRARVAPSAQFEDLIADGSRIATEAMGGNVRKTGVWDYIAPESDAWAGAWERVVNRQARRDPLFRMGMEGASREQMVTWLRSDEGLDYLSEFTGHVDDLDFVEIVDRQLGFRDALFGGSTELRRIALEREVSAADLNGRLPVAERTVISGETVRELERRGMAAVTGFVGDNIAKPLVDAFASLPADEMLRMPFFQHRYKETLLGLERSGLDPDDAQRATWRQQARQQALKDTEDMFYSHASRSRFAQMVRFLSPFFAPAENAVRSWARLTIDNPLFTARLANQYRELVETMQVTEDGESKFAVAPEPIADMLRMLPWMKDVPEGIGATAYPTSLNMIFQGPGWGPGLNVMFEDYVRNRPELVEDGFFKMLFPFGVDPEGNLATDFVDEFANPTVMARLQTQFGDDDRMNRVVNTLVAEAKVKMDQGLIPEVRPGDAGWNEFVEQKEREARSVLALEAAAKLWSPSSMSIKTWSDPYRKDLSAEYERGDVAEMVDGQMVTTTPVERFLRRNGDEYIAITQSMYDNRLSLATNLATLDALQDPELADWIGRAAAEDPQMARWIVGSNGAGSEAQNSYFAFQKMKGMETFPGSGEPMQELKPAADVVDDPDVQRGWEEYSAIMAEVDNLAEERGYTSLYVDDAKWLRDTRDEVVAELADEYPAWHGEFKKSVDRGQWDRRLKMMEDVASNDLFASRPGMAALKEYLQGRQTVAKALEGREHSTLTALSNEDLRLAYEEFVTTLVYQYPAFGEQFHYLIENADPFLSELDGEEVDNG